MSASAGRPGFLRRLLIALLVVVALAGLLVIVVTPVSLKEQAVFGATVFLVALILSRIGGRGVTLLLVVISLTVSSRYLHWRLTNTLGLDTLYENILAGILLGAEIYAFIVLWLGYLQSMWPMYRKPVPLPEDVSKWPSVDVLIPTYNEPLDVVRLTVLAARNLDWPTEKLHIWILDDGRREEFKKFAADLDVGYLTRPDNQHAKAGNINTALKHCRGEFVAVFDCDHVPVRSFLQMTMGLVVKDKRISLVQTPHHFNSPDPFERNLDTFRRMPNEGQLFYGLLLPGDDLWNAVFFCGSCAILRRSALDQVGGIAVETVTEDAHTGLRLHRKGHHSAYLCVNQASGLATESLSAHVGQRIRWARGMVQIFRVENPLLGRGLTLVQRLMYTSAMIHFLNGLPRLIFLTAPLLFLFGEINLFRASAAMVMAFALPHLFHATLTSSRIQGKHRHSFWAEVYETTLAAYIVLPTFLALISPKLGKFNVTAKGGVVEESYFDRKIAIPYLILLVLNLVGMGVGIWALWTRPVPLDAFLINVAWTLYNSIVLGAACAVAFEKKQMRQHNRVTCDVPTMIRGEDGRTVACRTLDISRGGAMLEAPGAPSFEIGTVLDLSFFLDAEELPLPAKVIGQSGPSIRISFGKLTLAQEEDLVRVLYGRANAWNTWSAEVPKDKPLVAYARIVKFALSGLRSAVFGRGGAA